MDVPIGRSVGYDSQIPRTDEASTSSHAKESKDAVDSWVNAIHDNWRRRKDKTVIVQLFFLRNFLVLLRPRKVVPGSTTHLESCLTRGGSDKCFTCLQRPGENNLAPFIQLNCTYAHLIRIENEDFPHSPYRMKMIFLFI